MNKSIMRFVFLLVLGLGFYNCASAEEKASKFAFDVCPNLGKIQKVPNGAIFKNEDGERFVSVKGRDKKIRTIKFEFMNNVGKITKEEEYLSFIRNYREICKELPNFIEEIPLIDELKTDLTQKKEIYEKHKQDFLGKETLYKSKMEQNNREISTLENLVKTRENKLSSLLQNAFLVTGQELSQRKDGILIYGTAIPKGKSIFRPGYTNKGFIFIMHPTDSMFVTPKFYKPAMIVSEELFFVKEAQTTNRQGVYEVVTIFTSKPKDVNLKELEQLKKDKKLSNEKLTELKQQNEEMEEFLRIGSQKMKTLEIEYEEASNRLENLVH